MAIKLYKKTANADGHGGFLIPVADISDQALQIPLCIMASQTRPESDFFIYDQANGALLAHYRNGQEIDERTDQPFGG